MKMIKRAEKEDIMALAGLAAQIWTSHTMKELELEFSELINKENAICFICYEGSSSIAFAQCGLRNDYVEGTKSSPVGYLEGIFVVSEYRNCGIAGRLLVECENWAKDMGCLEFASDCELDNMESLKFHIVMGFEETNRIICFNKKL